MSGWVLKDIEADTIIQIVGKPITELVKNAYSNIPADAEQFVIGRHTDCDLVLNLEVVSRFHCALILRGREIELLDLSRNGTWINQERCPFGEARKSILLESGAHIGIPCRNFILQFIDEREENERATQQI